MIFASPLTIEYRISALLVGSLLVVLRLDVFLIYTVIPHYFVVMVSGCDC